VSLSLPKAIYSVDAVQRAICDYRAICRIHLDEQEERIVCVITESVANLPLTAREFANYLIELSNAQRSEE